MFSSQEEGEHMTLEHLLEVVWSSSETSEGQCALVDGVSNWPWLYWEQRVQTASFGKQWDSMVRKVKDEIGTRSSYGF